MICFKTALIGCHEDMDSESLFNILATSDKSKFVECCETAFKEFGTSLRSNRFAMGNCVEMFIADLLRNSGLNVEHSPNANRYDLEINGKRISVKYSSSGNIKLHNSNNCINKDYRVMETLLVTSNEICLISPTLLRREGIKIEPYLKNSGDGLVLLRKLLRVLKQRSYSYRIPIEINTFKGKGSCENRNVSDLVYEHIMRQESKN